MAYSTEDCKKYLKILYPETELKGWKRIRKYHDEKKIVARDFEYKDGRKVTILETPKGLQEKKNQLNNQSQNSISDEEFQNFLNQIMGSNPSSSQQNKKTFLDMPRIYIDAISQNNRPIYPLISNQENSITESFKNISYSKLNTNEDKFLYVLVNGTQWDEEEGNQASTDFFCLIQNKENFIKMLISKNVNLYNMYLTHIINIALMVEAGDEGYIPFQTMEGPEALKDMCFILKEITQLYEKEGQTVIFDKDLIEGAVYTLKNIKKLCSMNDAEDLWEQDEIDHELDTLILFIQSKNAKKGMKP
jgi:hypothetical protein